MKDGSDSADEIFTYDLSSRESPSDGVVAAVSAATGRDIVSTAARAEPSPSLDPLYTVVDPDALDSIVRSSERDGSAVSVTFPYHEVTVAGDGRIVVRPLDRSAEAASD